MAALTKRQKLYREYLLSDHWAVLRAAAIDRDGGACLDCGASERLQVHHLIYRERWEDTLLADLETLCRKCHRIHHGLGPTDFESKCKSLCREIDYGRRPSVQDWKDLKSLMGQFEGDFAYEMDMFATVVFRWVLHIVAEKKEGHQKNWWMNKEISEPWKRKAFNVRDTLRNRKEPANVREIVQFDV